jgi:hypothetical protein
LRGRARWKGACTDPRQDSSSWNAYGWGGALTADGGTHGSPTRIAIMGVHTAEEAHARVGWGWAHMGPQQDVPS